jgi:paraquat-inducible protein B
MYRGAIVGRIERVQLNNDTSKVVVSARLNASAEDLAREGTLWWIVRPEVSLEGISGLDTLISPRYLTLLPGQGEPLFNFEGTPSSMIANKHLAGVKFTLITDSITGVTLGTPLYYRGIIVGTVGNIQFAPDSVAVLIDIIVKNEFSNLIRTNTKFWQVSGFDFDIGFTGISMNIGPVSSLLKGGIQLATPQDPGEIAHEGYGFILDEEMDEEWLEWTPKLPLLRDLNAK